MFSVPWQLSPFYSNKALINRRRCSNVRIYDLYASSILHFSSITKISFIWILVTIIILSFLFMWNHRFANFRKFFSKISQEMFCFFITMLLKNCVFGNAIFEWHATVKSHKLVRGQLVSTSILIVQIICYENCVFNNSINCLIFNKLSVSLKRRSNQFDAKQNWVKAEWFWSNVCCETIQGGFQYCLIQLIQRRKADPWRYFL